MGFLEFHKNDNSIIYHKQQISNVYKFLTDNKIDIVINIILKKYIILKFKNIILIQRCIRQFLRWEMEE